MPDVAAIHSAAPPAANPGESVVATNAVTASSDLIAPNAPDDSAERRCR